MALPLRSVTPPEHAVADRFAPRFARTFERSVRALRERVTVDLVAEDMSRGIGEEPHGLYNLLDGLRFAKAVADDEAERVYADLLANMANGTLASNGAKLKDALTVVSPYVQRAARHMTAEMVQGVTRETKRAIRRLIHEAVTDGIPPAKAQQTIRQIVGLTTRDAVAVARFAELPDQSAKRVERYANRLLRRRALNIARSETMRAANRGTQLAWERMAGEGLLDRTTFRQRWLTTPDDRLCELCAPMTDQTVSLGENFRSTMRGVLPSEREPYSGSVVDVPPLHPSCRCTLVADFA